MSSSSSISSGSSSGTSQITQGLVRSTAHLRMRRSAPAPRTMNVQTASQVTATALGTLSSNLTATTLSTCSTSNISAAVLSPSFQSNSSHPPSSVSSTAISIALGLQADDIHLNASLSPNVSQSSCSSSASTPIPYTGLSSMPFVNASSQFSSSSISPSISSAENGSPSSFATQASNHGATVSTSESSEVQRLKDYIDHQADTIHDLEGQLTASNETIDNLSVSVQRLEDDARRRTEREERNTARFEQLMQRHSEVLDLNSEQRNQISNQSNQISNLEQRMDSLELTNKQLRMQNRILEEANRNLRAHPLAAETQGVHQLPTPSSNMQVPINGPLSLPAAISVRNNLGTTIHSVSPSLSPASSLANNGQSNSTSASNAPTPRVTRGPAPALIHPLHLLRPYSHIQRARQLGGK